MAEKHSNVGGWITAVGALALFNIIQFSEKNDLNERIKVLEAANAQKVATQAKTFTPPIVETSSLTTEQKDNLEAERSFEAVEDKSVEVDPADMGPGYRTELLRRSSGNSADEPQDVGEYVGSSRSDKFHSPYCSAANRIKMENMVAYSSREDAISQGKEPCKICSP